MTPARFLMGTIFLVYIARLKRGNISPGLSLVETVEILDGRLGKRSVERVRYVINNLLHLVIVKYGVISLVLCISTRLLLVTTLSLVRPAYPRVIEFLA